MWKIAKVSRKLLDEANTIVPVITGELKDSGHVEIISKNEAEVIYDAPHAVVVHEKPGFSKGYKWLEIATGVLEDELIDMYADLAIQEFIDNI